MVAPASPPGGGLFGALVRRPVATWMVAIALAVFGIVSYARLPLDLMPNLDYPSVTVRTEAEGYAPEEVENQVSRPVEEAVATTPGLVELESRSRAGDSDVILHFSWGTDMNRAVQDLRERLETALLPDDVARPLILRYDPSQEPILRIALSTSASPDTGGGSGARNDRISAEIPSGESALLLLRDLADKELKRDLEAMDGIAAVRVRGGLERQIRVEPREDWLAARGVTIDQLIDVLGLENVNLPGGSIREGQHEYLVRTIGEYKDLDEVRHTEIRRADGVRVPVDEVATVREVHKDRRVITRLDGRESVVLEIYKAADANVVRLARRIRAELGVGQPGRPSHPGAADAAAMSSASATLAGRLPSGVVMAVLDDQAKFIESSLANLRQTAVLGAFLAIGILFLFLREFRATAIIATAIPLSVVIAFAPLYLGGVSLNLMSLGGLALGVGMLVDNAVVVLENITAWRERGADRVTAAVEGTREVAAAVTASTLTTICVFAPIAFVEGVAGQVFGDLSLAVVSSLLGSLGVALFFVPVLAAGRFELPAVGSSLGRVSRATRFGSFGQFRNTWRSTPAWWRRGLGLPWWSFRFLVRLSFELISAIAVFPSALLGRLLWKTGERVIPPLGRAALGAANRFQSGYGRFSRGYKRVLAGALARPGRTLGIAGLVLWLALMLVPHIGQALLPRVHQGRFTVDLARPVGSPLDRTSAVSARVEAALRKLPGVAHVHAIVGAEDTADKKPDEGENTARITIEMTRGGDLAAREGRLMREARATIDRAAADPSLHVRIEQPELFSLSVPMEVRLYGDDLSRLREAAHQAARAIAAIPGLTDVRSSLVPGYPEVRIRYDRDLLARFGLDTRTVATRVREKVLGKVATTLSWGDGRVDLLVRLDPRDRHGVAELGRINVNPAVEPPIPLDSVASLDQGVGPSEIRRVDQRRAAVLSANPEGFDLSGYAAAIASALSRMNLGSIDWEIGGQYEEMQRSAGSMWLALGLALFLVYAIMASTFESVLHPLVILFSVPLALIGVLIVLWLTDTPFSVVVFLGAIVLAGVVVNNAIVLVDTVNRLRVRGLGREAAIQQGAALRLRPILITTATTVLGLVPLALGLGEGSEIQRPLALTVIAGLSSSTLLTLVVVPVVYRVATDLFERRPEPERARAERDPQWSEGQA